MTTQIICARYNENINWLLELKNENIIIYNKGEDDLHLFPIEKIVKLPNLGREGGTYIDHIVNNYDNLCDYTIFIQGNPVDHVWNCEYERSYKEIFDDYYENKNYQFKYISKHFIHVDKCEIKNVTSGIAYLGFDFIPHIDVGKAIETALNIKNLPPSSGDDIQNFVSELEKFKNEKSQICMYEILPIMNKYLSFTGNEGHEFRREEMFAIFDTSHLENMIGDNYNFGYGALFCASRDTIRRHPRGFYENISKTLQDVLPSAGWGLEKMWKLILSP